MIKIFMIFYVLSLSAFTCEISLSSKILIIHNNAPLELKNHNCSNQKISKFTHFIKHAKGKAKIVHLQNETGIAIKSPSQYIQVINLATLLRNQIPDSEEKTNYFLKKIPLKKSFFELLNTKKLFITCSNCKQENLSHYDFLISFQDKTKKHYKLHGQLVKLQKYTVFKVNRDIPVFYKKLTKHDVQEVQFNTRESLDYFDNIDALPFLKTNRAIKSGEALLKSHFSHKKIVKSGQIITLKFISNQIQITTQAKALEVGRYHHTIKVKQLSTQKILDAKIINQNTGVIHL